MSGEHLKVSDHVLIRVIADGAFGTVWLARNTSLGTYRAVKIVARDSMEYVRDFQRELEGIQRFEPLSRQHPGLLCILHAGKADDDSYFYYVMELADDIEERQTFSELDYKPRTLSAELKRRGRIPAPEAAFWGAQLADGLQFLHAHELLHRDIKPENVLFVRGQVKIADPGLVAVMSPSRSRGGTVGYIAPDDRFSQHSDIYSLGKLLYVISTGKQPDEFPSLDEECTEFPDWPILKQLNLVYVRAASANQSERHRSAAQLRQDLLDVQAGGNPEETRRRLRRAKQFGLALAMLLALLALAFLQVQHQARIERARLVTSFLDTATDKQSKNDSISALPYLGEIFQSAADEPHFKELSRLWINSIWLSSPRLIHQWSLPRMVNRVAWSPNGEWIAAACSSGEILLMRPNSTVCQNLGVHVLGTNGVPALGLTFSPDGRWLASVGEDSRLRIWPIADSKAHPIEIPTPSPGQSVAFHPTKDFVAVACQGGQVLLGPCFQSPALTRILQDQGFLFSVAFRPDGKRLAAGGVSKAVFEYDLDSREVRKSQSLSWIYDLAYDRCGKSLVAATGNRAYLDPFLPSSSARLRHSALVNAVAFDPMGDCDDNRLLTASFDFTVRLWSCREDMESSTPIPTAGLASSVSFAPDGKRFVFSTRTGLIRLYELPQNSQDHGKNFFEVSRDSFHYAQLQGGNELVRFGVGGEELEARVTLPAGAMTRMRLNQNGSRVMVRQELQQPKRERFSLWDFDKGLLLAETNLLGQSICELSPRGDRMLLARTNGLWLWSSDKPTQKILDWSLESLDPVEIQFASGVDQATVGWGTEVAVLSLSTGELLAKWTTTFDVFTIDMHPSGKKVLVGESPPELNPGTNFVWDVATRTKVDTKGIPMGDGCYLVKYSPDGQVALLADEKFACVIYDFRTGTRRNLRQISAITTDANFSPDSKWVVTLTGERGGAIPVVQVWDVATGSPISPRFGVEPVRARVRFLNGGKSIVWVSASGHWLRWNLAPLEGSEQDLQDLCRLLSSHQVGSDLDDALSNSVLQELWTRLSGSHPKWFQGDGM